MADARAPVLCGHDRQIAPPVQRNDTRRGISEGRKEMRRCLVTTSIAPLSHGELCMKHERGAFFFLFFFSFPGDFVLWRYYSRPVLQKYTFHMSFMEKFSIHAETAPIPNTAKSIKSLGTDIKQNIIIYHKRGSYIHTSVPVFTTLHNAFKQYTVTHRCLKKTYIKLVLYINAMYGGGHRHT